MSAHRHGPPYVPTEMDRDVSDRAFAANRAHRWNEGAERHTMTVGRVR
jgi:hypothetical protein